MMIKDPICQQFLVLVMFPWTLVKAYGGMGCNQLLFYWLQCIVKEDNPKKANLANNNFADVNNDRVLIF